MFRLAGEAARGFDHSNDGAGVVDDTVDQLAALHFECIVMGSQQDLLAGGGAGADNHVAARRGAAAGEFLHGVGEASGVELGFQRLKARVVRRLREGGYVGEELLWCCRWRRPESARRQAEQGRRQNQGKEFHDASAVPLWLFRRLRQSN